MMGKLPANVAGDDGEITSRRIYVFSPECGSVVVKEERDKLKRKKMPKVGDLTKCQRSGLKKV